MEGGGSEGGKRKRNNPTDIKLGIGSRTFQTLVTTEPLGTIAEQQVYVLPTQHFITDREMSLQLQSDRQKVIKLILQYKVFSLSSQPISHPSRKAREG